MCKVARANICSKFTDYSKKVFEKDTTSSTRAYWIFYFIIPFFSPTHTYIQLCPAIKNTVLDPEKNTRADEYQIVQLGGEVFMKELLCA